MFLIQHICLTTYTILNVCPVCAAKLHLGDLPCEEHTSQPPLGLQAVPCLPCLTERGLEMSEMQRQSLQLYAVLVQK